MSFSSHSRSFLRVLFTASAMSLLIAGCSQADENDKKEDAAVAVEAKEEVAPVRKAVEVPKSDGMVSVEELMKPEALPDNFLGDENAPVTIVEYASLTCGHCSHFHETTWPELKKQYVDTGKVRFVLREFPFDPRATAAFMLARCAGDNYYPMIDVLFRRQNTWARAPQGDAANALFQTVKIAGFTQESFETCLKDQTLLDNVNKVRMRAADTFKVDSTPTFFINGKKYSGAMTIDQMAAIIDPLL